MSTNEKAKIGIFISSFDPGRSHVFANYAKEAGSFSAEYSTQDWPKFSGKNLFLLSFSGNIKEITCAALARRKAGPKNTEARNLQFVRFVFFEPQLVDKLLEGISSKARSLVKRINGDRGTWVPPSAAQELFDNLKVSAVSSQKRLDDLWEAVVSEDPDAYAPQELRLAQQRDAVGVALDVAGLGNIRRREFRNVSTMPDPRTASFVHLMDQAPPQERALLEHDWSVFKGPIAQGNTMQSAIFSEGPRSLRVWITDHGPIEKFAGVDLVIFNRDFNALLLVQYKCMEVLPDLNGNKWAYRPDSQFEKEVRRMEEVRKEIGKRTKKIESLLDARLNRSSLFFKFCKRLPLVDKDGELADGMFVGLTILNRFLASDASLGEKGGRMLGYRNFDRYLNNSLFAALARDGWIGTRGLRDGDLKEVLGILMEPSDRQLIITESVTRLHKDAAPTSRRSR